MKDFSGDVVVIVGGSSGIGKQTAVLFAKAGAQVILIARGAERLQKTAEELRALNAQIETVPADVASLEQVKQAANLIQEKYGRLDAMIYSAAVFYLSPAETMDLALARESMEINYWGAVNCTQVFLPLIRRGERKSMVYLSSLSAHCTPPFFTAYAATKHALKGLALSLRQELRPEGIHIGMVSPGPVNTPLIENELHQDLYRLPPGIPVLQAETIAKGVFKTVLKRKRELVLPGRLAFAAKLSSAFPELVDLYYRLSLQDSSKRIQSQLKRPTI